MKLATLLFGVRFFTVVAVGAFLSVVFFVNPDVAGPFGEGLFLVSFFASVAGMMSLALVFLTRKVLGDTAAVNALGGSFRQGALLSGFAIGVLLLARAEMLAWWTAALLFAFVLLVELSIRRMGEE